MDVHDIRKVSSLWWKANVNFLEVLYSDEIIINPKLSRYTKGKIQDIFSIKEDIVKMNLPYLYNACIGMHLTKKKQIDKGTQSTQQLVDKYGYDTKQALHAIRILEFLMRFADNGFKDFKSAIRYEDYDLYKTRLISIKNGKFSKELFEQLAYDVFCEVEGKYKDIYYNQDVLKKPRYLKEMLGISKKLAKEFPFVRIGFKENDEKVLVEEMSFTPGACLADYYTEDGNKYLGKLLDIKNVREN